MRVNDAVFGVVLRAVRARHDLVHAHLSRDAGPELGPALFPMLIASGFCSPAPSWSWSGCSPGCRTEPLFGGGAWLRSGPT